MAFLVKIWAILLVTLVPTCRQSVQSILAIFDNLFLVQSTSFPLSDWNGSTSWKLKFVDLEICSYRPHWFRWVILLPRWRWRWRWAYIDQLLLEINVLRLIFLKSPPCLCSASLPGQTTRQRWRSPLAMSSLKKSPAMIVFPAPGSSARRKRNGCLGIICS